jgi:hypothetical protein
MQIIMAIKKPKSRGELDRQRILSEYMTEIASKGGRTAAANMTPEARHERAKKAVAAREAKRLESHPEHLAAKATSKLDSLVIQALDVFAETMNSKDKTAARRSARAVKRQLADLRAGKMFAPAVHEAAKQRLLSLEEKASSLLKKD